MLLACTSNDLVGKTYYLINGHISREYYATLKETKLTFISSDKVEAAPILFADAMGYRIEDSSITKIVSYKYENGILELPDFGLMNKLGFLDDGNIRANDGEVFYQNSIVSLLGTNEAYDRISQDAKGNKMTVFKGFLDRPSKPLIKMQGDKIIFLDTPKKQNVKKETTSKQTRPKAIFRGRNPGDSTSD